MEGDKFIVILVALFIFGVSVLKMKKELRQIYLESVKAKRMDVILLVLGFIAFFSGIFSMILYILYIMFTGRL